ncbi:MAG TPA: type II toxin-antitoxin system HicA family toxin [Aeromicrobium sp.]|nr:type II toxin-antitoxin system HicA family toxin [Aeromicrobium sp.]
MSVVKPPKPKIPKTVNHDKLKAILESEGWTCVTGGKHSTKMTKDGQRPITIPLKNGKDFGPDFKARILRQAGLAGNRT